MLPDVVEFFSLFAKTILMLVATTTTTTLSVVCGETQLWYDD
jgi:hypothetical protein